MSDFRVEDIPSGWMNQIIYSLRHEWSMLKIVKIVQAWNGANIDLKGRIRLTKAIMESVRAEQARVRAEGFLVSFFEHTHTEQSKAGCLACGAEDCPRGWPHHYRIHSGEAGSRCFECSPLIMPVLPEQDCSHPSEKMEPTGNGQGRCGACGEEGFQLEAEDYGPGSSSDHECAFLKGVEDCDCPRIEEGHCVSCGAEAGPEPGEIVFGKDAKQPFPPEWDGPISVGPAHFFPGDHFMAISPPPVVYHRLVESWDAENVKYLAAKLTEAESEGKALLIDAKSVGGLLAWLSL